MSPYSLNYCDFQRFLLFLNKARNAGRSDKNAGNKPKCGIPRTIVGWLTPMPMCPVTYMDRLVIFTNIDNSRNRITDRRRRNSVEEKREGEKKFLFKVEQNGKYNKC